MPYYVYMVTNKAATVLYTGVTNSIQRRLYEHREKIGEGFTKRYGVRRLVYYEMYANVRDALEREKQIKSGSQRRKLDLVNDFNPRWRDLYEDL